MPPGTSTATAALIELVMKEEAACRALLETIQEERTAIRTLAITEFHTINCRRLLILESLQKLADARALVVRDYAETSGLALQTTTIHTVVDRLTGAEGDELRARYNALLSTARIVRESIKQNVVLIEGIRGVVDQALSSGATIVPGHDFYTSEGQVSSLPPVHALLHQQG